jgi:hypothetical protein
VLLMLALLLTSFGWCVACWLGSSGLVLMMQWL